MLLRNEFETPPPSMPTCGAQDTLLSVYVFPTPLQAMPGAYVRLVRAYRESVLRVTTLPPGASVVVLPPPTASAAW